MQKLTLFSLLAILFCVVARAQEPDYRFGKVSLDELRMEHYDKGPDAEAVYLNEENYLSYDISSTVSLVKEYRARIKVLKPEGVEQGNVSIAYYDYPTMRENITGIEAVAYNLVDGKIVKTALKRQYLFTEEVSKFGRLIKFSIPEVRAGTVIEYKYRLTSANLTLIPSFVFQHDIPVIRSRMEAAIPEFFRFNLDTRGYVRIDVTQGTFSRMLGSGDDGINYTINEIKAAGTDIPALKSEPFVWCLNDFRSMIRFELAQVALPFSIVKNYATSWADVNEALAKSPFDTHMRINNPFREEVAAIRSGAGTPVEKARAVLRLVQSKMKWNGVYRLFSDAPRAAVSKGTGSSADINFVLMAALKDAGLDPVPVLLSPRHLGRLSYTHPTIDGINAFVVRIADGEGYAYLDGTDPNSDVNLLPVELSVDRARVYGLKGDTGWINLTELSHNKVSISMILRIQEDGTLTGRVIEQYVNQPAMRISKMYTEAKSREEYVETREKDDGIRIEGLEIAGTGTARVSQSFNMTCQLDASDEYIYINSTVIPFMSTNELNAESRALPIEFVQPIAYDIRCSLEIPAGYAIEELPKNIQMTACENGVSCLYIAQHASNFLQFNFRFQQPRILFMPTEFEDLNAFFGMVADLSNSRIVIRKNAPQS